MAESGLSLQEREAVKQRAKELRAQEKAGKDREAGTLAVREAIEKLEGSDRETGEGLYRVVTTVAPQLMPKTYYGMPAFANDAGKVVVFLRPAVKFGERYATIGFEDRAALDDGELWPVAYAVPQWTSAVEARFTDIIRTAAS
ncbi:hypothetical protein LK09_02805 [Microbacterium mangrovi]|uniref:YdhG-like domain-containing protein n=1 Tax=Microbacterium mangrovi TaxID=1348253 RepID=A0A0B2ADA4_9MICO|nr:hypothetical protein [Microbacterium mangrovi]KHK99562.1 hypothetical protein LK09_02805 [Microbacterium mangrovi]